MSCYVLGCCGLRLLCCCFVVAVALPAAVFNQGTYAVLSVILTYLLLARRNNIAVEILDGISISLASLLFIRFC